MIEVLGVDRILRGRDRRERQEERVNGSEMEMGEETMNQNGRTDVS